jgi:hypothetical protein
MSTEASAVAAGRFSRLFPWTADLRTAKIVRFTVASTTAATIAFAFPWPLSFVCPVLTIVFLSKKIPGLTHRQWYLAAYVVIAMLLGLVFTLFLQPYPMVFVLLLGLVLFNIYYLINRGGSFIFGLICLLSVIILPMLSSAHEALAMVFALNFGVSAALAIVIFVVAHVLFPDPPGSPVSQGYEFQRGYSEAAAMGALKSTLAVLPLVVFFNAFEFRGEVLILVYAGILSLTAEQSAGWTMGVTMFRATLLGAVAATVVYWLLVAVPELHFFVVLWLVVMLIFARVIFSDHALYKYAGSAATAMTILVATSLGPGADYVGKIVIRAVLIGSAALYVGLALAVIERYVIPGTGKQPA